MPTFPEESRMLSNAGKPSDEVDPAEAASPASRLPLAGGLLFAVVAEALLLLALTFSRGAHLTLVELGVPLMGSLFALGSCLLVSAALQGRERGAWILMGLACLGALIAQATRVIPVSSGTNLATALTPSYPSLSSVVLIAQSIGFFLAFLLFPPPASNLSLLARLGQFFDGVLVVGSALVAVIYFVVVPSVQAADGRLSAGQVTTLILCVCDLLLLGGLTFALRSITLRQNPLYAALSVLGLAILLLVGADFASMVQTPNHLAPLDSPLQAIWNAGYLAIGLGALLRLRNGVAKSSDEGVGRADGEGPSIWLALPFAVTVVVAGSIVVHAVTRATTSTEMLVAIICASLLVALIGVRHLVGLVESRQGAEQQHALERDLALAVEQVEQVQANQLAQERARRESLDRVLDALTRFGYGDYQARVSALERELAPLAEQVNALLEGIDRQLNDRDRGRETRLIRILTDALGRLALGELHDLPELPTPGGSPLDGMMMGVVQVRTRLISLQGTIQQYEQEHYEAQQHLERARQELEQETQSQRLVAQEMAQNLEGQLYSERQVAQATEEQWQRERQRLLAQAQGAEQRVAQLEGMLNAAEQRLVKERLEAEQRLKENRQVETLALEASRPDPAQLARVRQQSEYFVSQFTSQAERLHGAAATLETAAGVAQRLARVIQETSTLPELQSASQPAAAAISGPLPEPPPPDVSTPSQPLSALQMLERLASGRSTETTPKLPVVTPASADAAGTAALKLTTGPLNESANDRVARRLQAAATRAEEIASGLLDLAKQCIQSGDESIRAAEEAGHLADVDESPKAPMSIRRTLLPARTPKGGR